MRACAVLAGIHETCLAHLVARSPVIDKIAPIPIDQGAHQRLRRPHESLEILRYRS